MTYEASDVHRRMAKMGALEVNSVLQSRPRSFKLLQVS